MPSLYRFALYCASFFITLITFLACEPHEPEFTEYRRDVTPLKIIDETFVAGGVLTLNSYASRVVRTIQLPAKTKYWAVWVGVGQESLNALKAAVNDIPQGARRITTDPFIAYGLEILKTLPVITGSDAVDCYFTDRDNATLFVQQQNWKHYPLLEGKQTVTMHNIYDMAHTPSDNEGRLLMTFQNLRDFRNLDVTLKVWAYTDNAK